MAGRIDTRRMLDLIDTLEREVGRTVPSDLTSRNPAMQAAIDMALQVARTDANVLILGESGTGKGVLARAVHRASPRAVAEFVTVNCPSLSAELMESELFGHSKGSFTGAVQNTVGRISHADGGTVFPVSYTHLDVDKRQVLTKPVKPASLRAWLGAWG